MMIYKDGRLYEEENELTHYGMPRRSGRYPWGSGKNPSKSNGNAVVRVVRKIKGKKQELSEKKQHKKEEKQIKKNPGLRAKQMSDDELRKEIARIQLERQYAQLNPAHVSAGRKIFNNFKNNMVSDISQVASNQAKNYINRKLEAKLGTPKKSTNLKDLIEKFKDDYDDLGEISDSDISKIVSRIAKEKAVKEYIKNNRQRSND